MTGAVSRPPIFPVAMYRDWLTHHRMRRLATTGRIARSSADRNRCFSSRDASLLIPNEQSTPHNRVF